MSTLHRPEWLEYVDALVAAPDGSVDHEIGRRVWELSTRDDILVYLTEVMTDNARDTRAFRVAWMVWKLLSGIEAAA